MDDGSGETWSITSIISTVAFLIILFGLAIWVIAVKEHRDTQATAEHACCPDDGTQ